MSDNGLRKINIKRNFLKYPEGSCLIEMGDTIVLATASIEEKVPPFLEGKETGWVTAEYSMLPRANRTRKRRDIASLKLDGRSQEIQRLIGRALRSAIDRKKLGERTITIDCDVLQGDGGTRTASINAGFIALYDACKKLLNDGVINDMPIKYFIGAVSVGKVDDRFIMDLCYEEDSHAIVDMNVVLNDQDMFIEVQGTGEENVFSESDMAEILSLAKIGIKEIILKIKEEINENSASN